MATVTFETKPHSAYCRSCGKFEFDTKDIGHFHHDDEVSSCLRCEYLAKCPTCDNLMYVGGQLSYIQISELFIKRSRLNTWGVIVSTIIKLDEE